MTTRRSFLKMLAITCVAPVRVAAGLMKAVPVRKIPTGEFLWLHTYLPLYTTPCCLPILGSTEIARKIASVQPMPPNCFKDTLAWFQRRDALLKRRSSGDS